MASVLNESKDAPMIRFACALSLVVAAALPLQPAAAQSTQPSTAKAQPKAAAKPAEQKQPAKTAQAAKKEPAKKEPAKKEAAGGSVTGKAAQLGTFGDWGAYMAGEGVNKVCFALSQPKERAPAGLQRDPAYVFITSRPAQNVRNEVSFTVGFPMKPGVDAGATVDAASFALEAKDKSAFVKNAAEEGRFVDAMRGGSKLLVKSTSLRGNVTTDTYSLSGLSKALEKLGTDCK